MYLASIILTRKLLTHGWTTNKSLSCHFVTEEAMFEGLSAWFSSSVGKSVKQQWGDQGGGETSLEDAQFIFSQDATALDTQRVFDSEAYLEEHLAVFHPSYIRECVKHGNASRVTLGKYFFPPADVQAIAKKQLQYQWDVDRNTYQGETSSSDEEVPITQTNGQSKAKISGNHTTVPVGHGNNGLKHKDVSRRPITSDTSNKAHERIKDSTVSDTQRNHNSQVHSTHSVQSNTHKEMEVQLKRKSPRKSPRKAINNKAIDSQRKHRNDGDLESPQKHVAVERKGKSGCLNASRKSQSDVVDSHSDMNEEERGRHKSDRDKRMRKGTSTVIHNDNEESEILRLEELAKVTGDLQDFIVGKNGCELVKIS